MKMVRWIVAAVLVEALTACVPPVKMLSPSDLVGYESSQLCTALAETEITGVPAKFGTGVSAPESALLVTLKARGEQCSPWASYMQMAQARVSYELQQQAMQAQRSAAMGALGIQMMQASRPQVLGAAAPAPAFPTQTQTKCHTDAFGRLVCNSTTQ